MTENNETKLDARIYEISYLLDDKMTDAQANAKAESLKASIAAQGGSFISEEPPYLRELAYEMIRVVSNVNVRFNRAYFGWVKFNLDPSAVIAVEKTLKLDEEVVRYITVKTVSDNTVFTKRTPVVTVESLASNEDGETDEPVAKVAPEVAPAAPVASEVAPVGDTPVTE